MASEVIKAVILLGGLGVFCGVVLGIVSRFFGVQEDHRVEAIAEMLPGANCGVCGFAGCVDYARAIVAGSTPPNMCAPGGPSTVAAIAEFLGVEAETRERKVALVMCHGGSCSAPRKFAYNGVADCVTAALVGGGDKACSYGCLGLGSCARVCPVDAIEITTDGLAVVHPELCISCGQCVSACPRQLISLVPESAEYHILCRSRDRGPAVRKVCAVGCIGCNICAKGAPDSCKMDGTLAVMDYETPLADPAVAAKCPRKIIIHRPGTRKEATVCA